VHSDGATIQYQNDDGIWLDTADNRPLWRDDTEYRAKPLPLMYCRFKKEYEDGIYDSSLCLVGGKTYSKYADLGYTPYGYTTFEEIE